MEWINLNEKKPINYTNVLVTDGISTWVAYSLENMQIFLSSHPDYKRDYWNDEFHAMPFTTMCKPTHWMPLPKPPEYI